MACVSRLDMYVTNDDKFARTVTPDILQQLLQRREWYHPCRNRERYILPEGIAEIQNWSMSEGKERLGGL